MKPRTPILHARVILLGATCVRAGTILKLDLAGGKACRAADFKVKRAFLPFRMTSWETQAKELHLPGCLHSKCLV